MSRGHPHSPCGTLIGNLPQALIYVSVVHNAQLIIDGVEPGIPVGRWLGARQRVESTDANRAAEVTL